MNNEIEEIRHCNHENILFVQVQRNGIEILKEICRNCAKTGNALKRDSISPKEYNQLPKRTSDQVDAFKNQKYQERNAQIRAYYQQKEETRIQYEQQKREEWLEWYHSEYLQSETWQQKRKKILERDNYLCQGCLATHAIVVHHISYEHVGYENAQELYYELTSLCRECHDLAHTKIDNTYGDYIQLKEEIEESGKSGK